MDPQGYSKESEFQQQQQPPPPASYGAPPPAYSGTYHPQGQPYPAQPPPANYGQSIHTPTVAYNQTGQTVAMTTVTQSRPSDYMGLAIFATFCCCWPIGIFAIMKASQVSNHWNRQDYASAQEASNGARKLSYISIGFGVASIVMSIIFVVIYFLVIVNSVYY